MADDLPALLEGVATYHRLGRQPSLQDLKNELLKKLGLSQQPAAAPRVGLLTGIAWHVTR